MRRTNQSKRPVAKEAGFQEVASGDALLLDPIAGALPQRQSFVDRAANEGGHSAIFCFVRLDGAATRTSLAEFQKSKALFIISRID